VAAADPLTSVQWSDALPLLHAAEEVELAEQIEVGVLAGERLASAAGALEPQLAADLRELQRIGHAAFDRFVRANVRLAAWHARRRVAAGGAGTLSFDDLVAEGMLGIIRAVHKWDYRQGVKFSTYAWPWIKNFQQRAVLASWPITLPAADQEDCRRLLMAAEDLTEQLQRTPTVAELAEAMATTGRHVSHLLGMLERPLSLDAPVGDGKYSLAALLPDPSSDPAVHIEGSGRPTEDLPELLSRLNQRERDVVSELFGLNDGIAHTVDQIAAARRVPARLVATTAEAALRKLRSAGTELRGAA
jgi:RNA polymerase sigma factor (sigma-70 family)